MSSIKCDIRRLPLGRSGFSNLRKLGKIYVDKTKLIYKIAEQDTPIFFSRPRRFGKSLLINTLHSLFENGIQDFTGLALEKMWNDRKYKVANFDFSRIINDNINDVNYKLSKKIIEQFSDKDDKLKFSDQDLQYPDLVLDKIAQKLSDYSTVLLIDEYDAPLTHNLDNPNILHDLLTILNSFYATIKQYTDKFRFIFITGVTKASHVSIFSAFNNLKDLSLDEEFNSLLGFTSDDLVQYFDDYIDNAGHILKISKDEVYSRIQKYYDGFQFSFEANQTMYNPWSILSFIDNPKQGFKNYWFESGGISSIVMKYIKITDEFNLLDYNDREIYVDKNDLSYRYEITNIPREILLFQAGYFTIKKISRNTARLVFPNAEVEDSILRLFMKSNKIKQDSNLKIKIDELSEYIDQKDIKSIVYIFNSILNDCVSILSKIFNDERSVRDIIYAALPQEINLQKIKERETVRGYSDLELLTRKTHMVIEFKRTTSDNDAEIALEEGIKQLKRKNYGIGAFPKLELFRVAMVISSEKKILLQDFCKVVI